MNSFNGKYGPWCVIAGGSEGIGAAFAREVAARGIRHLLLIARKPGPLEAIAATIRSDNPGVEVQAISQDLAVEGAVARIKVATEAAEVGLFIYNAGAETSFGDFLDHDFEHLRGRLQRNFVVKTELLHHFGGKMRSRGHGGVILLGSIAGYFGSPGFALYGASKSFTHFLSEALWYEFGKHGIDLLCPVVGPTDTPAMVSSYGETKEHRTTPEYVARESLDRLAEGPIWVADDIATQIAAFVRMPPAERPAVAARMAAEFTRNK